MTIARELLRRNEIVARATKRENYLRLGLNGVEPIRIVAHDASDAGVRKKTHVGGMVYGPADDLQVAALRFGYQGRRDEVAANAKLARTDFESSLDRPVELAVIEKSSHQGWLGTTNSSDEGRIEGDDDRAGDFTRIAKRANQSVFTAPRTAGFQLKIENHVVPFCKIENFFERGNSFSSERTAEPGAGVETAKLGKSEFVDGALSVGSAVDGVVVNCDEACVARKLKICFDEAEAHGNRFAKGSQGIFGRVTRGAAVRDQKQGEILLALSKSNTTAGEKFWCRANIIFQC